MNSKKLKTCIVGDSSIGKTTIIVRIIEGNFKQGITGTVGVDYKLQKRKIKGEENEIEIWDTTGQDRFRSIAKNFFRNSDGIFLCFSMIDDKSVESLQFWLKELRDNLEPEVPIILLGNKSDVKAELSASAEASLKQLFGIEEFKFYKVSAKSGVNIKEAYEELLTDAVKYRQGKAQKNSVVLPPGGKGKSKKGCC